MSHWTDSSHILELKGFQSYCYRLGISQHISEYLDYHRKWDQHCILQGRDELNYQRMISKDTELHIYELSLLHSKEGGKL